MAQFDMKCSNSSTPAMDQRVLGKDGFVRIRYWPLVALAVYLSINLLTAVTLICAHTAQVSPGFALDPLLHAPLIWLAK